MIAMDTSYDRINAASWDSELAGPRDCEPTAAEVLADKRSDESDSQRPHRFDRLLDLGRIRTSLLARGYWANCWRVSNRAAYKRTRRQMMRPVVLQ